MQTTISSKSSLFSMWQTKTTETIQTKKDILTQKISHVSSGIDVKKSLLFFKSLQRFMVEKDYSAREATGLDNGAQEMFNAIKKLANNRNFIDAAVTKSLALAIVANIIALDQNVGKLPIIDSETGKISREGLSAYLHLMLNFDPINIECIMHYTHDMRFDSSSNEVSYSNTNILGFSVDDDYKLKIAKPTENSTVRLEGAITLNNYMYENSNTVVLMNANEQFSGKMKSILNNIKLAMFVDSGTGSRSSYAASESYLWMHSLLGAHGTQQNESKLSPKAMYDKIKSRTNNIAPPESSSYQTPSGDVSVVRSIRSEPSVYNNLTMAEREQVSTAGSVDEKLPINAWEIKYKSNGAEYFTHCVGAFGVNRKEPAQESIDRAYNYLLQVIPNDNPNLDSWIIDSRLLDGIYHGEPKIFERHRAALTGAVERINRERGEELNGGVVVAGRVKLICTHIPTTIKEVHFYGGQNQNLLHPFNHVSNTKFDDARTQQIGEFKAFLDAQINALVGIDQQIQVNLLQVIDKLCKLLNKPKINAADGLLYDALLTILVRYIPHNLHNIVACRSAKDRTTAEKVALNALKAVIEGKIESSNDDFVKFLNDIVKANKLNIKAMDSKDKATFISRYDDKALYFANEENTGVKTNINVAEMRYVLSDFLYIPKIRESYSRVHPGY